MSVLRVVYVCALLFPFCVDDCLCCGGVVLFLQTPLLLLFLCGWVGDRDVFVDIVGRLSE